MWAIQPANAGWLCGVPQSCERRNAMSCPRPRHSQSESVFLCPTCSWFYSSSLCLSGQALLTVKYYVVFCYVRGLVTGMRPAIVTAWPHGPERAAVRLYSAARPPCTARLGASKQLVWQYCFYAPRRATITSYGGKIYYESHYASPPIVG